MTEYITESMREESLAELHAFIKERSDIARFIIDQYPKTYSSRSMNGAFDEGWRIGFHRCLAEFKRVAEQHDRKQLEG